MELLFATGNAHKLHEVRAILGTPFSVAAVAPDVEETGTTFADNALLKAHAVSGRPDVPGPPRSPRAGRATVAEDSGIVVDALGGRPGVHSARWTAESDWIPRVLRELAGVPDDARTARYVAVVAWVDAEREVTFEGVVEGHIADGPRGVGGFGYDPIFVPLEGDGRTFAEMGDDEKHQLSHRGRAFRALADWLDDAPPGAVPPSA